MRRISFALFIRAGSASIQLLLLLLLLRIIGDLDGRFSYHSVRLERSEKEKVVATAAAVVFRFVLLFKDQSPKLFQ